MKLRNNFWSILAGGIAGMINGLFGAGGGMVLVPILARNEKLKEDQVFPCSVFIILPICIVSLFADINNISTPLKESWPYLSGGIVGGLIAGIWGQHIPTRYLHRTLGLLILWGGVRYLC